MSDWKRIIIGLLWTIFVTFVTPGYQALLPVMRDQNVYSWLCDEGESTCNQQTLRLTLMFEISMGVLNGMCLPVGFIIEMLGPRRTSQIGAVIICAGVLLFAFSSHTFDAYIPGYVMISAGGPFVAFSMFTLPALAPDHMGVIFSLLAGAFDASSAMFLFMQLIANRWDVKIRYLFLGYLAAPASLIFISWWLFPPPPQAETTEITPLLEDTSIQEHKQATLVSNEGWAGRGKSTARVLKSKEFVAATFFTTLYLTTKYFYMGNVDSEVLWITNSQGHADDAARAFSILLPASGFFTLLTSPIMERCRPELNLVVIAFVSTLTAATSVLRNYALQYFTMVLVVFNRFYLFAFAPFIFQKLFGLRGIGRFYGISLFIAAAINESNYAWSYLCKDVLESYMILNLTLFLCAAISSMYFAYIVRIASRSE